MQANGNHGWPTTARPAYYFASSVSFTLGLPRMTKRVDPKNAVCCFCGRAVPIFGAVVIVVYRSIDSSECQNLYTHPICLRDRVILDVPLLTDLVDD